MTFACQDPICSPGWNLCRLRLSKIIRGQIWGGIWYGSKRQMTAAMGQSANVCEVVCPKRVCACFSKCPLHACPHACAWKAIIWVALQSSGHPTSQFRLTDEKKSEDGSYVNKRHGLYWHLPPWNHQPLTPLAPFHALYQPDVAPAHICHSRDPPSPSQRVQIGLSLIISSVGLVRKWQFSS